MARFRGIVPIAALPPAESMTSCARARTSRLRKLVQGADRILVLTEEGIGEQGTHDELIAADCTTRCTVCRRASR